ncbi:rhodanese-like domain-containing protein [Pedosphaera parvula]|nr:rhodanese-like domain-containing protein [Pedosphaera parvula]
MNMQPLAWLGLFTMVACNVSGITVAELQARLAKSDKLTIIDVRSPIAFTQGHIPNAINVPASLCADKKLPPLGQVIVCGEGLGHDSAESATVTLNTKPGITAEKLDGGYIAWEATQSATTRDKGLQPEALNYITYAQLKNVTNEDVVLVDLRKQPTAARTALGGTNAASATALSDLGKEFPGLPVTQTPFKATQPQKSAKAPATPSLMVLIDNGDGSAQSMARTLKANGIQRYVILAGGEEIITRKGQSGLQRSSSGFLFKKPNANPATTK